jgi:hypothetical protein
MYDKFTITCPSSIPNKIEVIKAIRTLAGLGLKEAKDASERMGPQTFAIAANTSGISNPQHYIEQQFQILTKNGAEVGEPVFMILEDLRKLGAQALLQGEDELASEILQLVLAEKLRRAK